MTRILAANPYSGRADHTFWRRSVTRLGPDTDPVTEPKFTISRTSAVATAGSCFAQHLSRRLLAHGYSFLVTETFEGAAGTTDENYGVYPARFGNVYTARQLLQLFQRAYGEFEPAEPVWTTRAGARIDPFRPNIQEHGFPDEETLAADTERHLAAARRMFESCDLFIFTLGLTEAWRSVEDGAVVPLAPGVVDVAETRFPYAFVNFTFDEVVADTIAFIDKFRTVNERAKIMLTVSPVPLIATFEDRHVLVSTIASKSILRAAVETVLQRKPDVEYFPSYEIITGPSSRGLFYGEDLREVKEEGVRMVMSVFQKHYLPETQAAVTLTEEDEAKYMELMNIICDEERIA